MVAATATCPPSDPCTAGSSPIHPSTHSPVQTSPHSPLPTPHSPLPSPLPPLPAPDEALISRFFEDAALLTLQALFDTLKTNPIEGAPKNLLDFFRWSQRDDIKPWLNFHTAQLNHRRGESDYAKRTLALDHLEDVLKNTTDLIEKRRAATAVLRTLNRTGSPWGTSAHRRPTRASTESRPSPLHPLTHSPFPSPSSPSGGGGPALRAGGGYIPTPSPLPTHTHTPESTPPPTAHSPLPSSPPVPRRATHIPPPGPTPALLTQAAGAATLPPEDLARLAMRLSLRRHLPEYLDALKSLCIPNATFENKPISNFLLETPVFHPNGAKEIRPRGEPTPTFCQFQVLAPRPPHQIVSLIRYPNPTDPWFISDISTEPNPDTS